MPAIAIQRSLIYFPYASNRKTYTIGVIVHELQSDFIKAPLLTHSHESMEKEVANRSIIFC